MEADLQRFYGVDYRDRWRSDEHGRPRLTLRRLAVLVFRHPPEDGAVVAAHRDRPVWSRTEHLLDEVRRYVQWGVVGGRTAPKPHPDRIAKASGPGRDQKVEARRAAKFRRAAVRRRAQTESTTGGDD